MFYIPLVGGLSHCGYVLCPIGIILALWFETKRFMCESFPFMVHSQCGIVLWCMVMYKHETSPHGLSLVNGQITYHALCNVGMVGYVCL